MQIEPMRGSEVKPMAGLALPAEPTAVDPQQQRTADAALRRPSPPDQAQISPEAQALAQQELESERANERLNVAVASPTSAGRQPGPSQFETII